MYELRRSFSKGVDRCKCFGRDITYLGSDRVSFLSGTCGVIENLRSGHQRLITPSQQNGTIESVFVSSSNLSFLERDKHRIFIRTFDPISIEMINSFEIQGRQEDRYIFVSTTYQEEIIIMGLLVPQQHNLSWTLSLYRIDGEILCDILIDHDPHVLHSDKVHIQMSITSFDSSIVCIQNHSQFWFFRYCWGQKSNKWEWKLLSRPTLITAPSTTTITSTTDTSIIRHGEEITCHTSLRVLEHNITVFGTNSKRLIITESGVVQTIYETNHDISCIENTQDLLLVGCSEVAIILVFSISSNTHQLNFQRKIQLSNETESFEICGAICDLAISPDGTNGCVTIQPTISEPSEVASTIATFHLFEGGSELNLLSRFIPGHACKEKVIMSTSIQNDILASVGRQSLFLFDIQGNEICCRKMEEQPLWVCLHPSGLHILLAFEDEVRCEHILMDEFKTFWRKPGKNTRMCEFSSDGEKFGMIQDCSILVFDFISGELIQELKHSSQVVNFVWLHDKTNIISHNEDGILYRWNSCTGDKETECAKFKSTPDMIYVATKPDTLWIQRGDTLCELYCDSFEVSESIIDFDSTKHASLMKSSYDASKFCIVVLEDKISAPMSSYVRLYDIVGGNFIEIKLLGRVSGIVLSSDDTKLYAFLTSGILLCFDIVFHDSFSMQESTSDSIHLRHKGRDTLLVSDSYLQEQETIIVEYEAMLKEEHNRHSYRMELTSLANQEEIARLSEQLSDMSNTFISKLDQLQADQQYEREKNRSDIEAQQQVHQHELEQLEANYKLKIEKTKRILNTKESECITQIKEKERVISELKSSQAIELESIQNELQTELDLWKQKVENIKMEIEKLSFENEEAFSQTEYDIDKQVETSKSKWHHGHNKAREDALKSSSDNAILTKKTSALLKSIDERKDMIQMMLQRQKELEKQKISLEHTLKRVEKEYQHQIEQAAMKNGEIKSLQKNQNLLLKQNESSLQNIEHLRDQISNSTEIKKLEIDIESKQKEVLIVQNDITKIEESIMSFHQDSIVAHQELKKYREKYSMAGFQYNKILGMIEECLSTDLLSAVEKLEVLMSNEMNFIQDASPAATAAAKPDVDTVDKKCVDNDDDDEKELLSKELKSLKKRFAQEEKQYQEEAKIRLQENQKILKHISECRLNVYHNKSIKKSS